MNEQPKNETPQSTEAQAATGFSGPRWAKDLGEETWDKINTLLHDGWDTPDIIRELELPTSKLRSLQIYAAKFGPTSRASAGATGFTISRRTRAAAERFTAWAITAFTSSILPTTSRPGFPSNADRTPRRCARLAPYWNDQPGSKSGRATTASPT
jgi:hypothetical protein